MTAIIPTDVFDWLQSRGIVTDSDAEKLQGGAALNDQELQLGNGLLFSKLLAYCDDGPGDHDLKTLKTARTPVGRLEGAALRWGS